MSVTVDQLATRLGDTFARTEGTAQTPGLWQAVLRLLSTGKPATIADIAAATGQAAGDIAAIVSGLPSVELDDEGNVVGYGITLRPTPHRFTVDGVQVYTWCALDTLIFPGVLGRTAQVESPCHATGQPVRLTVEPGKVTHVEPGTAVVSVVTPDDVSDVRSSFCVQVHFFSTPQAAQPWLAAHPGAAVLPVADAFQLGRRLDPAAPAAPSGANDTCC